MLSDLLSDTIVEIERYQKAYPEKYNGLEELINEVKINMDDLRHILDMPPLDMDMPPVASND